MSPRMRIFYNGLIAFGPGKADLLEAVHRTGSITCAAEELGMSYMRAWSLIKTMNRCFNGPLVIATRGGTEGGGGTDLTELGLEILSSYRRMERKCINVVQPEWKKFRKLCEKERTAKK